MCALREQLEKELLRFTKDRSTISLHELEKLVPNTITYEEFAPLILQLEDDSILDMVKSQGRNHQQPSLAYRYRIHRHTLNRTYYQELQTYRLQFHNAIKMDAYFNLSYATWTDDLPYLKKIDSYIKTNGLPTEKVPAPERSYELVGDEKWIEQGGNEVLQRTQLFDAMNIFPVSDPLMFAVNPKHITAENHFHLIVENKTTYQALLPVLTETTFSTLIYGSGNKIPKSIENFPNQFPAKGKHTFFYFGDIDRSGITIWHSLYNRQPSFPAVPFYEACFQKEKAYGKTNQRLNETALVAFSEYFTEKMSEHISELLKDGAYFPQEVLKTKELQQIWLETDWRKQQHDLTKRKERITQNHVHK